MSCCGHRRRAYKAWLLPRPVRLRSLASEPIRAVGRVTGNVYEFSSASPEMDVDARDAVELLKATDFALAGADSWQDNKIISSVAGRASAERNV